MAPTRRIRFVTTEMHEPYGHRTGAFQAAYQILKMPDLREAEHAELSALLN